MSKVSGVKYNELYKGWVLSTSERFFEGLVESLPAIIDDVIKPQSKSLVEPKVNIIFDVGDIFWLPFGGLEVDKNKFEKLIAKALKVKNLSKIYCTGKTFLDLDESNYLMSEGDFRWIRFNNQNYQVFNNKRSFCKYIKSQDLRPGDVWLEIAIGKG